MFAVEETLALPLKIENQGLVYQDRTQQVYRILAQFDGFTKEYYVSDRGQRAAVLVARKEHVLLARQYRLIINRLSMELPGGKVDVGETPEAAAARECQEEIGVKCSGLKHLLSYHPGLDITQNHTHIFYAHDFVDLETHDSKRRVWLPLSRCMEMVSSGEIADGLTIMALLAYNQFSPAD